MKHHKVNLLLLLIPVLFAVFCGGYFWGRSSRTEPAALCSPVREEQELRAVHTASRPQAAFPLSLNTASARELDRLPGVGPSLARAIVLDRQANGPFSCPEDLLRVRGIGEKRLAKIRDYITVEECHENSGS